MDEPALPTVAVTAFLRDGFVLPRGALEPAVVARLVAAAEAVASNLGDAGGARVDVAWTPTADPARDPVVAAAEAARLVALIAPLIGREGVLSSYSLLFAAQAADAVPWRADTVAVPSCGPGTVSVRVALTRADRDNGCMRLLPRSHERLVRAIRNARDRGDLALPPDGIDRAIVVDAVRNPGEMTLYAAETLHCEPANPTGRPRAAIVFRYRAC